jgi:hypothetical protein
MTDRALTPIEREAAAILEADIRTRLGDGPVTANTLKAALIGIMADLDHREAMIREPFKIERDPLDPNRINISGPGVDWMRRFAERPDGLPQIRPAPTSNTVNDK